MTASGERGTRARILKVAEDFLGERGYDGTRLHLIAQRVGIQKASLFHYFPSKEDLYRAVLDEGFGETEQIITQVLEMNADPLEKVRLLVAAYVDVVAAHPKRTKIFLRQSLGDAPDGPLPATASQRLLSAVVQFISQGQEARVFAAIDPLALVLSVVGMVAFFFTSGPVLAPAWLGDPWSASAVERVKGHVIDVVERCLTSDDHRTVAVKLAGAGR
jgi:TetR/AcrR family transcriptional regulator